MSLENQCIPQNNMHFEDRIWLNMNFEETWSFKENTQLHKASFCRNNSYYISLILYVVLIFLNKWDVFIYFRAHVGV